MESEKKPSIFSDRGFIGSAGELDEYGVWVKSEPEDISFDNNAFFDDIGNEDIGNGAEIFGFDADAAQLDIVEPSDRVSADQSLDTAVEPEAEIFDIDFDIDEPAEEASGIHTDEAAASPAAAVEPEAEIFDIDFDIDEPAEEASGIHTDEASASPAAVEPEAEIFDIDFDIDEPAEEASGIHTDEASASPAAVEPEAEIFDIDFDVDEPAEEASGIHTDEGAASPAAVEPELETFDMDFDVDEPAEEAPGIHTDEGAASPAAVEPELETFDMDFDADEPAEEAPGIHTDEAAASPAAVEPELETFDMDFDVDEPAEQASGIHVVEFSDAGDEPLSDASIADIPESHDAGADLAQIHEEAQAADTAEAGNAALPQVDARSTELLLKIVDELATIKTELSRLKDEISNIRENAVSADFQIDNRAGVDDESETLSSEELAAVIKNASIELKEPEDITGKHSSVLDTEFLQMEDTAPQSDEAEHIESPAEDSVESPELSVDLDLSEEDVFLGTPPFSTEADAAFSEILEDNIVVPSLPQDEAYTEDYLPPDELSAVIADDDAVLNEIEPSAELEPEPAAPPSAELEPEPAAPQSAELEPEPPAKPSKENKSSHSPVVPPSEIDGQTAAQTAPPQTGQNITDSQQFKKELQVVLSYMDRLLESLPDEKIEEFARSRQFDVYKKVFKELGLA
jgi:hypothetical protein